MKKTFSRKIPLLITLLLFLYLAVPLTAPVLMRIRLEQPAKIIYKIYSPLCHQLAYRSWFLFGVQSHYPLVEKNHSGLLSYEQAFGLPGADFQTARSIIGNKTYGYKIPLCQRDIAIHTALFLFGFIFITTGQKIKKIPLVLWLTLGVAPLGLDGLTQLLNYFPWGHFSSIFLRESTPVLRTITGSFFGFFTGWYMFPAIQEMINQQSTDGLHVFQENK